MSSSRPPLIVTPLHPAHFSSYYAAGHSITPLCGTAQQRQGDALPCDSSGAGQVVCNHHLPRYHDMGCSLGFLANGDIENKSVEISFLKKFCFQSPLPSVYTGFFAQVGVEYEPKRLTKSGPGMH